MRRLVQRSNNVLQEAARRHAAHGASDGSGGGDDGGDGGGDGGRGSGGMRVGAAQWERLGFVLLFGAVWRYAVLRTLEWVSFPTHLHPWEAALFQVVPVAIVVVVVLLDAWCMGRRRRKAQ